MADIFVSYTSSDRDWAFWIAKELEALGHTPHVHEWEIKGSEDIYSWMQKRLDAADRMLCVTSEDYLTAAYSTNERNAALWKSATNPGFALIAVVKPCEIPTLFAHFKRYELHSVDEQEARTRIAGMFAAGRPAHQVLFPGAKAPSLNAAPSRVPFPGTSPSQHSVISNIPINVPRHFLGREENLAAIESELKSTNGRVAITALHGLRGVGKTTLAAAYAERRAHDYRATWWIRAETESTMRADLAGLGIRLNWVAADTPEEAAVTSALTRLRDEGDGILLIYDNATSPSEIRKYLPRGGAAQIIVTSNAPNWGAVAAPVEVEVWPKEVGADYLIARSGRREEREAAMALSEALGGLPLAHEQAAAYCERIGASLNGYKNRFEAAPVHFMDDQRDASHEYHDGLTVAKTFALAIDEAAKLHPAAETLIVYAALLAPEPIPLFLFSEARKEFGEPLASALTQDGLDEVVAALRSFALVDRETVPDERDPHVMIDCIRLHRLVRQVAASRLKDEPLKDAQRRLIEGVAAVYPAIVYNDPQNWPRARKLDPLALLLLRGDTAILDLAPDAATYLLDRLATYRQSFLADYVEARQLFEEALAICERVLGPNDQATARTLNNLGLLLHNQGDLPGAQSHYERVLEIMENDIDPNYEGIASCLNNLGYVLKSQGHFKRAQPCYERALDIYERTPGQDFSAATCLNNLGILLQAQGDLLGARTYYERSLAIWGKVLDGDHPNFATSINSLGHLLSAQGDFAQAEQHYVRALAMFERTLGPLHPTTRRSARNLAVVLDALGRRKKAKVLRKKYGVTD